MDGIFIEPTITDVLKAHRFLKGKVRNTPVEYSHRLSEIAGAEVYLKCENLQQCGSFKIRGALYKMNGLSKEEMERGIVTSSSGNHGQGAAMAAKELGIALTVFVPDGTPKNKITAIERMGGNCVEVLITKGNYDVTESLAKDYVKEKGLTYISAYEDARVIAGQGTAALELMMDVPDIDFLLVPAGGGGLINGTAIAASALRPGIEVMGVQSEASNPWSASWKSGKAKKVDLLDSIADGLTGNITQHMLNLSKKNGIAGFADVTERSVEEAIAFMHREHRMIVEGAGAVGVAALLSGRVKCGGRKTGVIISGGNIDADKLLEIAEKGAKGAASRKAGMHRGVTKLFSGFFGRK
jgi:threonine dehydratase